MESKRCGTGRTSHSFITNTTACSLLRTNIRGFQSGLWSLGQRKERILCLLSLQAEHLSRGILPHPSSPIPSFPHSLHQY